ncbi:hypothetical protein BX600DRAFT_492151 [Xylariales sp. PMI_506]|nr:hypothetical protein BX600DRAFT_492151 [Xylariales sp. PMI_506]
MAMCVAASSLGIQDSGLNPMVSDPKLKRRIQNRIAQRNSRQRRATQKGGSQGRSQGQYADNPNHCHHCCDSQEPQINPEVSGTTHTAETSIGSPPKSPLDVLLSSNIVLSPIKGTSETAMGTSSSDSFEEAFFSSSHTNMHTNVEAPYSQDEYQDIEVELAETVDLPTLDLQPGFCAGTNSIVQQNQQQHHNTHLPKVPRKDTQRSPDGSPISAKQHMIHPAEKRPYKPLHQCSMMGNHRIVEILLQGGADINATDGCGRTALHYGAEMGHRDVVKILLQNGADTSIIDHRG